MRFFLFSLSYQLKFAIFMVVYTTHEVYNNILVSVNHLPLSQIFYKPIEAVEVTCPSVIGLKNIFPPSYSKTFI